MHQLEFQQLLQVFQKVNNSPDTGLMFVIGTRNGILLAMQSTLSVMYFLAGIKSDKFGRLDYVIALWFSSRVILMRREWFEPKALKGTGENHKVFLSDPT